MRQQLSNAAGRLRGYRKESIFACAVMPLARSALAEWMGVGGVRMQPLVDALKQEILGRSVLHADEMPVAMLTPGKKKHKAYLWRAPGCLEEPRRRCTTWWTPRPRSSAVRFANIGPSPMHRCEELTVGTHRRCMTCFHDNWRPSVFFTRSTSAKRYFKRNQKEMQRISQ